MTATAPSKPSSGRWGLYGFCIAAGLLICAMSIVPLWKRAAAGENDFLQLYAGARLVGTPQLYDAKAHEQIHVEVTESRTYYPSICYTRLPFYALLLHPLSKLPYRTAYYIYQGISFAAVGALLVMYARKWSGTIVLASLSMPLLLNFTNGQDAGIAAALVCLGLALMRRGRDFLAGMALSLCSIKVHLFLLVPIALIFHKRWRVLQGGLAGGAALWALSIAAAGFDWPKAFLGMASYPVVHAAPEQMPTFRNLTFLLMGEENLRVEMIMNLAGALLAGIAIARARTLEVSVGLALAGGLLVAHHAYSQDLVLLLLAAMLFATGGASKPLLGWTIAAGLPPTVFLLLWGRPFSTLVPLLILGVIAVALAVDARRPGRAMTSAEA